MSIPDPLFILVGMFALTGVASITFALERLGRKGPARFWAQWAILSSFGIPLVAGYATLFPSTFGVGLLSLPFSVPGLVLGVIALSGKKEDFSLFAAMSLNPLAWTAVALSRSRRAVEDSSTHEKIRSCRICSVVVLDHQEYCSYCGYRGSIRPQSEEQRYKLYCMEGNSKAMNPNAWSFVLPRRVHNSLERRNSVFDRIKAESSRMKDIEMSSRFVVTEDAGRRVNTIKDKLRSLIDELYCLRLDLECNRFAASLSALEEFSKHPNGLSVEALHGQFEAILKEFDEWQKAFVDLYSSESVAKRMQEKESALRLVIEEITMFRVAAIASKTSVLGASNQGPAIALAESDYHAWMDKIDYEIYRLEAEKDLSQEATQNPNSVGLN